MSSQVEYAGFGRRLLAHLIDTAILLVFVILPVLYLLSNGDFGERLTAFYSQQAGYGWQQFTLNDLLPFVLSVFFWVRYCGTPGKLLLGCRVVDADSGANLTAGRAVIRYLGYIVSVLPLGLGFWWILWDKRRQGFHDKLAKSVVLLVEQRWQDRESQKSLEQLMKEAE